MLDFSIILSSNRCLTGCKALSSISSQYAVSSLADNDKGAGDVVGKGGGDGNVLLYSESYTAKETDFSIARRRTDWYQRA